MAFSSGMLEPTHRWIRPSPVDVPADAALAGAQLGLSPRLLRLLVARGCTTGEDVRAFVGPPEQGLHPAELLPDAAALRARLATAREQGERVMVLGDFDADGLSGLAIMVRALCAAGIAAEPYVPDRIGEGHGLSVRAVEAAERLGCCVIVTVDCGTSSREEVALAASRGIDVAVTDHHHVPPEVPSALALVNPRREDAAYPERHLTGAGVAFKVAGLLLDGTAAGRARFLDLADLAAIGTVADLAPLLGENRAIVRLGLDRMRTAPRAGIAALLAASGIAPERADADAIAWAIAPRINAAGRVGEAMVAARLLLTDDPAEAERLAAELEAANRTRRELTAGILDEARQAAGEPDGQAALVVAGAWPAGIIGLVAGKLAEETRRPAVVFSTLVSPWRGSARSGAGMDLARAFAACAPHLVRFGGHAGAAGCDMDAGSFDAFRAGFLALAEALPAPDPRPELRIDMVLPPGALDYALYRELALLAPTGTGNPVPVLAVEDIGVTRVRAASGGHAQLTFAKGREVLDGIAFDQPDLAGAVHAGDRLDVAVRLTSRTFGGFETLQLEVLDAAMPSADTRRPAIAPVPADAQASPAGPRVVT
jgi:single-stranded-DNA-specific exonuclease